jgi:hypothetical protein
MTKTSFLPIYYLEKLQGLKLKTPQIALRITNSIFL